MLINDLQSKSINELASHYYANKCIFCSRSLLEQLDLQCFRIKGLKKPSLTVGHLVALS